MSLAEAEPIVRMLAAQLMEQARRAAAEDFTDQSPPGARPIHEGTIAMVFGFIKGQFIDVIHWVDDTRDTMVWRFERQGHGSSMAPS